MMELKGQCRFLLLFFTAVLIHCEQDEVITSTEYDLTARDQALAKEAQTFEDGSPLNVLQRPIESKSSARSFKRIGYCHSISTNENFQTYLSYLNIKDSYPQINLSCEGNRVPACYIIHNRF